MAAARSIRTYDESKGTLWVWLWGVTRLQVSLHFRKCQQQARLNRPGWLAASQGRLARWLEGNDSLAPDLLESAELQQLVRTVLIELPDDYAELLIAKYLEDEPILVIAERERTTETAVRSKLARAREAFRGIFKKLTGETMTDAEACHEHT
jgi:RNA polymerase sigma-70 factor (ECF subfamily)